MALRSISVKQLKFECITLERAVLQGKLATEAEIAPWRPGEEKNPAKDASGWLRFYTRLHRFHARGEMQQVGDVMAKSDADVLNALRSHPVQVDIESATPLFVYPKSMDALMHVHGLDLQLKWMTRQLTLLQRMAGAEAIDAIPKVLSTMAYTYQLLCWIITTKGPGMPYEADDPNPTPPEYITSLDPLDIIKICQAHHKHLLRLHALTALIDEKAQGAEQGTRPTWSSFFGSMAIELKTDEIVLMKQRSLISLMATVRLNNAAHEHATEEEST